MATTNDLFFMKFKFYIIFNKVFCLLLLLLAIIIPSFSSSSLSSSLSLTSPSPSSLLSSSTVSSSLNYTKNNSTTTTSSAANNQSILTLLDPSSSSSSQSTKTFKKKSKTVVVDDDDNNVDWLDDQSASVIRDNVVPVSQTKKKTTTTTTSSSSSKSSNVSTVVQPDLIVVGRKKRIVSLLSSAGTVETASSSSSAVSVVGFPSFSSSSGVKHPNQQQGSTTIINGDKRESVYVCEDGQLELSCQQPGKHIDVLRANFGRFSITLCNPSGFLDWSVNCASGNSILPILTERCGHRNKCSIEASSSIFGDPCPGTSKYLEVHYRCTSGIEKINSFDNNATTNANRENKSQNNNINSNDANKSANDSTIGSASSSSYGLIPSDYMKKLSDNDGSSSSSSFFKNNNNNRIMDLNQNSVDDHNNNNNNINEKNEQFQNKNELISPENLSSLSSTRLKNKLQQQQQQQQQQQKKMMMIPVPKNDDDANVPLDSDGGMIPNHSTIQKNVATIIMNNKNNDNGIHHHHQQQHYSPKKSFQQKNPNTNQDLLHNLGNVAITTVNGAVDGSTGDNSDSNAHDDDDYYKLNNMKCNNKPGMVAVGDTNEHCKNLDFDSTKPESISINSNSNNQQQWSQNKLLPSDESMAMATTTVMSATACQPIIYRDIKWPKTLSGSIAIRPCPHDTSGLAQWKCGTVSVTSNSHFSNLKQPESLQKLSENQQQQQSTITNKNIRQQYRASWIHFPDLSQCHSRWLLQLHSFQNFNNFRNDMWRSILANLQRSPVYGGDIIQLNGLLENWSQRFFDVTSSSLPSSWSEIKFQKFSNQINGLDTIFDIVSELLSSNHQPTWFDLPEPKREAMALQLMDISAKYASLYCLNQRKHDGTLDNSKELIKKSTNLIVSCFSISKLIHEFQLNWNNQSPSSNNNNNNNQSIKHDAEFRIQLFPTVSSSSASTSSSYSLLSNKVKVYLILNVPEISNNMPQQSQKSSYLSHSDYNKNNNQKEEEIKEKNKNYYFAMLIPFNLENYFQFQFSNLMMLDIGSDNNNNNNNYNKRQRSLRQVSELDVNSDSLEEHGTFLNSLIDFEPVSMEDHHHQQQQHQQQQRVFINGQVIKFIQFDDNKIVGIASQTGNTFNDNDGHNSGKPDTVYSNNYNNNPDHNNNNDNNHHHYHPNHNHYYSLEIIFKHFNGDRNDNNDADVGVHAESLFQHQCVHWDSTLNHWSNEHCTMIETNATHSICRCDPTKVSICTVLAIEHQSFENNNDSTNQNGNTEEMPNETTNQHHLSKELTLAKHWGILSLTLIIYIWIALILIRYHHSYFNKSNFVPLLLICIVRTLMEISSITMITNNNNNNVDQWPEWWFNTNKWCQNKLFLIIYQLEVICSLFAVLLFPNVIFCILASKIYLTKNYINSLQAIKRTRQIQILLSICIPFIQLLLIYCLANSYDRNCWPQFDGFSMAVFVTSPILQLTIISAAGIIYLHCSQRIFSEYDYPTNMQCIHLEKDTSLMEKHIMKIFFSRCKHGSIWIMATIVYLICVVGCLCCTLLYHHTSYAWIGFDIAITLTFVLFARVKYLFNLIVVKCFGKGGIQNGRGGHRSSNKSKYHHDQHQQHHCYSGQIMINGIGGGVVGNGGGGQESASSSIDSKQTLRDNSISILSDTSKTFLTLPHGNGNGQISSSTLASPKIYPINHQSSLIYGNGNQMNPSSHLYESPSHLYNYEYEQHRYFNGGGNKNGNIGGGGNLSSLSTHNIPYHPIATNTTNNHQRHHQQPLMFYGRVDSRQGPQGLTSTTRPLPPPLIPATNSSSSSSMHRHSLVRDSNMSLNRIIRPNISTSSSTTTSGAVPTSATSHLIHGPTRAYSFDQYS